MKFLLLRQVTESKIRVDIVDEDGTSAYAGTSNFVGDTKLRDIAKRLKVDQDWVRSALDEFRMPQVSDVITSSGERTRP